MCFRFEEPLHRFQNTVIDRMVGTDRVPDGDDEPTTRMFPDPA
jgi:choline monooxygenase